MSLIEAKKLTFSYGKRIGIRDVDLSVEEGGYFGIIGPASSGKTTLIRCLLGLLRPRSGSASIFGLDCTRDASRIARDVGYMPALMPNPDQYRVGYLLHFLVGFYGKRHIRAADDLAGRLGLDLGLSVSKMSEIDKKKLSFIQAVAHQPRLIILDEPGNGIDPFTNRTIHGILREHNNRGATILMVAHEMGEVQRCCDHLLVMRDGQVDQVSEMGEEFRRYKKVRIVARNAMDLSTLGQIGAHCAVGTLADGEEGYGDPNSNNSVSQVSNIALDGTAASFMFRGDAHRLLEALRAYDLEDIVIEDASAAEAFQHFLKKAI